jgi:hypothetical protein
MKKLLVALILAGGVLGAVQTAEGHNRLSVRVSYGYPHYYRYPVYAYAYSHRYPAYRRVHRPYYAKGYFAPRHRFQKRYVAYGCY